MRQLIRWRTVTTVFTVAAIVYAIRTGRPEGTFLKVPYDFRFPTVGRLRERFWNPQDPRIFTPHYFRGRMVAERVPATAVAAGGRGRDRRRRAASGRAGLARPVRHRAGCFGNTVGHGMPCPGRRALRPYVSRHYRFPKEPPAYAVSPHPDTSRVILRSPPRRTMKNLGRPPMPVNAVSNGHVSVLRSICLR